MAKVTFPAGKEVDLQPARFTSDSVRLLELIEMMATAETRKGHYAEFFATLRRVLTDCIVRSGLTAEEADALLSELPFGDGFIETVTPMLDAIGLQ